MSGLRRIKSVSNIPKYKKFAIKLDCGHRYIFDHSVTKMYDLPLLLPCKICFNSHK